MLVQNFMHAYLLEVASAVGAKLSKKKDQPLIFKPQEKKAKAKQEMAKTRPPVGSIHLSGNQEKTALPVF